MFLVPDVTNINLQKAKPFARLRTGRGRTAGLAGVECQVKSNTAIRNAAGL